MASLFLLAIVLVLNALAFTFTSIEALPTNGVSELRPNNLGQASSSTTKIRNPSKRQKQEDTEDEEGTQAGCAAGAVAPGGQTYLTNTAQNVGTILGGLIGGNISDVLTGGTSFIPPGDLRSTVNTVVQGALIPTVERVSHIVQSRLNQTTTTPLPGLPTPIPTKTTTASSGGFNPFQLIQERLQGGGDSGDNNPLKAIQNRLQSFLPSFSFGGSSSSSADSEKNVQSNTNSKYYYSNRPIPGVNGNTNNIHQSESVNSFRNNIQSQADTNILSSLQHNNNILNNLQNNNNDILNNLQYNNNILTNLQNNNNNILSSIQSSNINTPNNIQNQIGGNHFSNIQNNNHNIRNNIHSQSGSNFLSNFPNNNHNILSGIQSSNIVPNNIQSSDNFRSGVDNVDGNRQRQEELPFAIPSSASNQNIPASPI